MATTTPNFGWPVPTSTDLVKNGATAIEALGDAIDASLVDLEGGTTGQVLAKASNADMDFAWVAQDDSNAIQNSIVDAKGDLISATGNDTPARLAVGANGETLVADSSASVGLRYQGTMAAGRNFVLNGGMDIWQRSTSATDGNNTYITADRWLCSQAPAVTFSRQLTGDSTNLPFIQYCMRLQRASGSTSTNAMNIAQSFESVNSVPLAGKAVTLSFYARRGANFSASGSSITVQLFTGTGTDQNVYTAGYTGSANPINQSAVLTTTWQRFSYTATLATNTNEIGVIFIGGVTGTAGAADFYEITGIQLEVGSVATQFARQGGSIQGELSACQRYYYRQGGDGIYQLFGNGIAGTATQGNITVPLPSTLRTTPSSIDSSTLAVYDGVTVIAVTAVTSQYASKGLGNLNFTVASGLTVNRAYFLLANNSTNAFIGFSAEL